MSKQTARTILEHSRENILLIPDGLPAFEDAFPIMTHRAQGASTEASIYRKLIRASMMGVEFLTSAPCLAYVLRGRETFYDHDGGEIVVSAGEMLLMPRQLHMVSDFSNDDGPLEALLFFFDDRVISDFLKATSPAPRGNNGCMPSRFAKAPSLEGFVAALPQVYGEIEAPAALVRTKLLELLLLLDLHDESGQLRRFLVSENPARGRRNIKQVMRQTADLNLSVADYAQLSGRSVSSFQRDFKRAFGVAPGSWLREARLLKGHDLVINSATSISDIAHMVGYADTSHFIKAFRSKHGQTPKQLRQTLT